MWGIIADSHDYKLGHVDGYHGVLGRRGVGKSGQKWPKVGGFLRDGIASGRGVHRK